jgi:hypothetical protein
VSGGGGGARAAARTPVLLEVPVAASRGDDARGFVMDCKVALEGHISVAKLQACAQRLEGAAAARRQPRVVAQQRQVRGVAAARHARRHRVKQAEQTAGGAHQRVQAGRDGRLQRRAAAQRAHAHIAQTVDDE